MKTPSFFLSSSSALTRLPSSSSCSLPLFCLVFFLSGIGIGTGIGCFLGERKRRERPEEGKKITSSSYLPLCDVLLFLKFVYQSLILCPVHLIELVLPKSVSSCLLHLSPRSSPSFCLSPGDERKPSRHCCHPVLLHPSEDRERSLSSSSFSSVSLLFTPSQHQEASSLASQNPLLSASSLVSPCSSSSDSTLTSAPSSSSSPSSSSCVDFSSSSSSSFSPSTSSTGREDEAGSHRGAIAGHLSGAFTFLLTPERERSTTSSRTSCSPPHSSSPSSFLAAPFFSESTSRRPCLEEKADRYLFPPSDEDWLDTAPKAKGGEEEEAKKEGGYYPERTGRRRRKDEEKDHGENDISSSALSPAKKEKISSPPSSDHEEEEEEDEGADAYGRRRGSRGARRPKDKEGERDEDRDGDGERKKCGHDFETLGKSSFRNLFLSPFYSYLHGKARLSSREEEKKKLRRKNQAAECRTQKASQGHVRTRPGRCGSPRPSYRPLPQHRQRPRKKNGKKPGKTPLFGVGDVQKETSQEAPCPQSIALSSSSSSISPSGLSVPGYWWREEVEYVNRFSRQLLLPDWGPSSQEKLRKSSVLVVGCGGLGCPVALYLSAAGVGRLGLVDGDHVEISNLHRQIGHTERRSGMEKVKSLYHACKALNSKVSIDLFPFHVSVGNALHLVKNFDVVVDATDNQPTRYLLNDACVLAGRPLVCGSALRWEGQLCVYNLLPPPPSSSSPSLRPSSSSFPADLRAESAEGRRSSEAPPCYRCLHPVPSQDTEAGACDTHGVIGPVPGIIGLFQALETIKICGGLAKYPEKAGEGRLWVFDGLDDGNRFFRCFRFNRRREGCISCGGPDVAGHIKAIAPRPEYLHTCPYPTLPSSQRVSARCFLRLYLRHFFLQDRLAKGDFQLLSSSSFFSSSSFGGFPSSLSLEQELSLAFCVRGERGREQTAKRTRRKKVRASGKEEQTACGEGQSPLTPLEHEELAAVRLLLESLARFYLCPSPRKTRRKTTARSPSVETPGKEKHKTREREEEDEAGQDDKDARRGTREKKEEKKDDEDEEEAEDERIVLIPIDVRPASHARVGSLPYSLRLPLDALRKEISLFKNAHREEEEEEKEEETETDVETKKKKKKKRKDRAMSETDGRLEKDSEEEDRLDQASSPVLSSLSPLECFVLCKVLGLPSSLLVPFFRALSSSSLRLRLVCAMICRRGNDSAIATKLLNDLQTQTSSSSFSPERPEKLSAMCSCARENEDSGQRGEWSIGQRRLPSRKCLLEKPEVEGGQTSRRSEREKEEKRKKKEEGEEGEAKTEWASAGKVFLHEEDREESVSAPGSFSPMAGKSEKLLEGEDSPPKKKHADEFKKREKKNNGKDLLSRTRKNLTVSVVNLVGGLLRLQQEGGLKNMPVV